MRTLEEYTQLKERMKKATLIRNETPEQEGREPRACQRVLRRLQNTTLYERLRLPANAAFVLFFCCFLFVFRFFVVSSFAISWFSSDYAAIMFGFWTR